MAQTTYQVILSTDGKHTVIVTSDDPEKVKAASGWAKATYDGIVERYGGKAYPKHVEGGQNHNGEAANHIGLNHSAAAQNHDFGDSQNQVAEQAPVCGVHGVLMVRVQGKHGPFYSCHEKNPDGNWCSYKPKIAA